MVDPYKNQFSTADFEAMCDELARQTRKHTQLPHNDLLCQAVLSEECGEVARAILEANGNKEHLKEELLQVACFALRWRGALD